MDRMTSTAPIAVARIARALTYLVYAFVIVALIILLLGFFLQLFGANPDAPFAEWLYRGLRRVMAPFRGCSNPSRWTGDRSSTSRSSSQCSSTGSSAGPARLHRVAHGLIVAMRVDDAAARGRATAP
jgi:uncharacterized protein YggT (Ycf19 family)